VPKWNIKGYDDYYISYDGVMVNNSTGRIIKKRVKGYSVGYTINGKFTTLKKLRPLIYTIKKVNKNVYCRLTNIL
jgi:hypothetical protein